MLLAFVFYIVCDKQNRHPKFLFKMTVFLFVLEFTPYGEAATEKVGVHLSIVWWSIGGSNP